LKLSLSKFGIGFSRGLIWFGLLLISACSKGGLAPVVEDVSRGTYREAAFTDNSESPQADTALTLLPGQTRKLVMRAELQIQVTDPETADQTLTAALQQYGAYTASTRIYERRRDYTIRVPAASYETLFAKLRQIGNVRNWSESAEDASLNYYDLEGRLATKQELLKTFQSYLGKAKTIDEIMTVEQRIAELQHEIDWIGTEFRSLSNQIEYATIELNLLGPALSAASPSLGERIGDLCRSFRKYLSIALVALLGIIMYGIPGIVVLVLWYWLLFGKIGLMKKLWRAVSGK
jgi:hypothetical protein